MSVADLCRQTVALPREAPSHAARVLDALEAAGHEAWIVGGWVRDALRGVEAHDVDICTSAPWELGRDALVGAGIEVHETGTAHGTITAVVGREPIEVTTYRVDGSYTDRRHPDAVTFVTDVREDLARRDFTVNAMAWHPRRGLLDPFGGRRDLAGGMIRAVGTPEVRFEEDALRVLRAVRFACRLGFAIEPKTQRALQSCAPGLARVARERVGVELRGILASGRASWALRHEARVMSCALPELGAMYGFDQHSPYHAYDVMEHTARVLAGVECFCGGVVSERLRWAALLHDVGKPRCFTRDEQGRGHFFGHPHEGAVMTAQILRELAIPGDLARPIVALVRLHDRPVAAHPASMLELMRDLDRRSGLASRGEVVALMHEMLDLRRADAVAKAPDYRGWAVKLNAHEDVLRDIAQGPLCWRVRELAASGSDIMAAAGIAPGPAVGALLERVLTAQMALELPNEREAILAWVGREGVQAGR